MAHRRAMAKMMGKGRATGVMPTTSNQFYAEANRGGGRKRGRAGHKKR